jgi:hypothetical protein
MCANPTCTSNDCIVVYGECHCGCGEKTSISVWSCTRDNYKKGVARLFVRYHGNRLTPYDYIIDETTGCWIWQRDKTKAGYGRKSVGRKNVLAHKYYYERKFGRVPKGLEIDHFVCSNPVCCNPDHMKVVTHTENCCRGRNAKLTWEKVRNIRYDYENNETTQKKLSHKYGVARSNISRIVTNKAWVEKVVTL